MGYAAVLALAADLLYKRHLYELNHSAEVAAASGMYAGGDALLDLFIACLFMIGELVGRLKGIEDGGQSQASA